MGQKLIKQYEEKDCGIACMQMILANHKSWLSSETLRELSGTDTTGTTAFGLKKCLTGLGFNCEAYRTDSSFWEEDGLPFPFIAHVIIDEKYLHYCLVYGKKNDQILIADPGLGKRKLSLDAFQHIWTGILLTAAPAPSFKPQKEKSNSLFSYLHLLIHGKKSLAAIILVSILLTALGILSSYYFRLLIDWIIPQKNFSYLGLFSISLIVVYLASTILEIGRNFILAKFGQYLSSDLLLRYLKHVFTLPAAFFQKRKTGEIVSRFSDANKIIDALASASLSLFLDIGTATLTGFMLFFLNQKLFFFTLLAIPFYLLIILAFQKKLIRLNEKEMQSDASLDSTIIEGIQGIETVKAFNGEQQLFSDVSQKLQKTLKLSLRRTMFDTLQQSLKKAVELLSTALVLWIGSYYVMQQQLSLGQLITFNTLVAFFTNPIQNMISLQEKFQKAQVANRRLNDIFAVVPELDSSSTTEKLHLKKEIRFSNVSFHYENSQNGIDQINLVFPIGSKIGLIGESGCGKSTLAKLLVGFYSCNQGDITFDEESIQQFSPAVLREAITYVPQQSSFFSGTIKENICFGLSSPIKEEKLFDVLEKVQLGSFISQQPLGLQTYLEEGGTNLSGGQKQRLALARALIAGADILILDEATSAVDVRTEKKILTYLMSLDKTILSISHRLPVAKQCDLVYVLKKGMLAEQGTHELLVHQEGEYAKLWRSAQ